MIRVVLVDDHPVVRAGLRGVLDAQDDIEVVGDADNVASGLAAIAGLDPDVIVLDMHLGNGPSGLDLLVQLAALDVNPNVLIVTVFDNDHDIDAALAEGAAGYILKDAPEGDLVRAVRAVVAGGSPLDPRVAACVVAKLQRDPDTPTGRELEVLAAVAEGHDNADIARKLYISQATVKSHLTSLFTKLGVASRTGAVAEARRRGHLR